MFFEVRSGQVRSYCAVCRSGRVNAVVNAVVGVFPRLSCWWKADSSDIASVESKMTSLTLLMKLLIVNTAVLSDSQHPSLDVVWSMYTGLLTDSKTSLAFKVCAVV